MIVEEFPGTNPSPRDFICTARPCGEVPRYAHARWRDPDKRPPELASEISFPYCSIKLQEYVVHLFGFPSALPTNYSLRDLQFPMELQNLGFVVILDLDFLPDIEEFYLSSEARHDPLISALAWIRTHELPFVAIAREQEDSSTDSEELQSIFELSVDVPICRCSSSFDGEFVQQVLCSLLAQFEAA